MPEPVIVDEDILVFRMVKTSQCRRKGGEWEFQSNAFVANSPAPEDPNGPKVDMSVVLGDTLEAEGRKPENLPNPDEGARALSGPEWGVAVIPANALREKVNQTILRTPDLPDEPAHGDVRGRKRRQERSAMKENAEWVVRPAALVPPEQTNRTSR